MNLDQLADRFPVLWPVTFDGGWKGIADHGLLRAIDVAELRCSEHRAEITPIEAPAGFRVVLRDQIRSRIDPTPYLDNLTPAEWWRVINSRVYFFCRQRDADVLVDAYLRRRHVQEVIKLRTSQVLRPVMDAVEVATVNAGVFPRTKGPSRGRSTFVSLSDFPAAQASKIKEITVQVPVRISSPAVTSVIRFSPDGARYRAFP